MKLFDVFSKIKNNIKESMQFFYRNFNRTEHFNNVVSIIISFSFDSYVEACNIEVRQILTYVSVK